MTTPSNVTRASDLPTTYEFRLAGHLDDRWSEWFGGHTLVRNDDASTTLTIEVADQAQLHGLLAGIRDLGVTLLSLNRIETVAGASRASNLSSQGTAAGRGQGR
jgi:hypothetical protein